MCASVLTWFTRGFEAAIVLHAIGNLIAFVSDVVEPKMLMRADISPASTVISSVFTIVVTVVLCLVLRDVRRRDAFPPPGAPQFVPQQYLPPQSLPPQHLPPAPPSFAGPQFAPPFPVQQPGAPMCPHNPYAPHPQSHQQVQGPYAQGPHPQAPYPSSPRPWTEPPRMPPGAR